MASVRKEVTLGVAAARAWEALREAGDLQRVVPGFVKDCRMEGEARVVTFGNGLVATELIVDLDDAARRLVWSARSERLKHHNAVLQVFEDGPARCRVVWIADVLPHEAAQGVGAMMEQATAIMKKTLEAQAR